MRDELLKAMKNPETLHIDTINSDWCDKDIVLLHACFQLLTDCIENEELLNGNTDWNYNAKFKAAKAEIEELNKWWGKRKLKINAGNTGELNDAQYEEDNKMLIRLIKTRKYLWT